MIALEAGKQNTITRRSREEAGRWEGRCIHVLDNMWRAPANNALTPFNQLREGWMETCPDNRIDSRFVGVKSYYGRIFPRLLRPPHSPQARESWCVLHYIMVRGDNTNQLSRPCDAVVLRYPSCKSIYSELLRKLLYSAVGLHHLQGKAIDCPLSTHLAYELAGADLVVIPQGDLQRTSTQLQTESNSQPQKRTKIPKYCLIHRAIQGQVPQSQIRD